VIEGNLEGYSGTFAHYMLYKPARVLFDCGEGAGIRLDRHVVLDGAGPA